jgi:phosphatidylglycerol:prolipoprotein diacylglycerol transferase
MRIGVNPAVFSLGEIVLTWHGLFTIIAVITAVYLMIRWSRDKDIVPDVVLAVSVWAILGGIIGARLVHVIDFWSGFYRPDPVKIVMLWNGGLDVFGAVLGGLASVWLHSVAPGLRLDRREIRISRFTTNLPVPSIDYDKTQIARCRSLLDIAALVLPLALAVGRIANLLDGSQPGTTTNLPWGLVYTHVDTTAYRVFELGTTHPAVVYEILCNLAIFGALWFVKGRVRPEGMLFALFLGFYAIARFFVGFVRYHGMTWLSDIGIAQLIALVVLVVIVPLVSYRVQLVRSGAQSNPPGGRR